MGWTYVNFLENENWNDEDFEFLKWFDSDSRRKMYD